MKQLLLLFLGVIITASLISGLHIVQGLILNDLSGLHPYNRLFQLPVIIAAGFSIGLVILFILRVMKVGLFGNRNEYFKLGLLLGLVGVSGLVHPYVNSEHTDWLVVLSVFIVSLIVAVRFSLRRKGKTGLS